MFNVLGAGDAFMAGFLRGWLRGEPHATSATWANACGAFAVSRLLCSPEYPTWTELQTFLEKGSPHHALRRDEALNHIHWATTRRAQPETLFALAIDHRAQLEAMADEAGAPRERIAAFKRLAVKAAARVADGRPGFGMLLDGTYGREALFDAAKHPLWIGRPVEQPGSRPLRFEGGADIGSRLVEWPVTHTVKCLAFYHPDDDPALKEEQVRTLRGLYDAARRLEPRAAGRDHRRRSTGRWPTTRRRARSRELYAAGIKPDWWKLEPQASAEPGAIGETIAAQRSLVPRRRAARARGAGERSWRPPSRMAARPPIVKGFAVGRTIFAERGEGLARRPNRRRGGGGRHGRAGFERLVRIWESCARNAKRHEGDRWRISRSGTRRPTQGRTIHVTPESAGWTYVGFDLCRLKPGESARGDTSEREVCLVLISGRAAIGAAAVFRRDRRADEPVRGKAVVGLRAGRRRLDGDGRDRGRARRLLGARQPGSAQGAADPARRTCTRRRAARASTSATSPTSCRNGSRPTACSSSR